MGPETWAFMVAFENHHQHVVGCWEAVQLPTQTADLLWWCHGTWWSELLIYG